MTKQLYLIDYENAQWCGGQLNVVVWAQDADEAALLAEDHMTEVQRQLFADEYEDYAEEYGEDDESPVSVNSVEPFGPKHEQWEFYLDPSQAEFYPVVGEPN